MFVRNQPLLLALGVTMSGVALSIVSARLATTTDDPTPVASKTPEVGATRVLVPGGALKLAPNDWEALGKVLPLDLNVERFALDRYEVTVDEWAACGACAKLHTMSPPRTPVTSVTAADAQHFCETRGGRLPTSSEWIFAASTPEGYRYPWGQTGLVCRKAVFGMVNGPCGDGARWPSPVGTRDLGATPNGIYDLCGNAAEWVTDGSNLYAAGGSFRSTLAGQLKVWALEATATARDDIGFRCAYDE